MLNYFPLLSLFTSMGKCLCKESKIISVSTCDEIYPSSLQELNHKLISLIFFLNSLLIQSRHQYEITITVRNRSDALRSKVQEYQIESMLKEVRSNIVELENLSLKASSIKSIQLILRSIENIENQIDSADFHSLIVLNPKKSDFPLQIPKNFPLNTIVSDIDARTELTQGEKGFKRRKYFKKIRTQ